MRKDFSLKNDHENPYKIQCLENVFAELIMQVNEAL